MKKKTKNKKSIEFELSLKNQIKDIRKWEKYFVLTLIVKRKVKVEHHTISRLALMFLTVIGCGRRRIKTTKKGTVDNEEEEEEK